MKPKSPLTAGLFVIAAALSLSAVAAPDTAAEAKPDAKAEKAVAKKKMKPHSHLEEKLGVPAKSKEAKADEGHAGDAEADKSAAKKPNPANDKSKHFHPRDGGKL